MQEIIKELEYTIKYFENAQSDFQRGRSFQAKKTIQALRIHDVSGSLPLETKLEMFYDFLYERGIANQLGVGIDAVVKHFIDEKLSGNDR